jgi:hypothetical protein
MVPISIDIQDWAFERGKNFEKVWGTVAAYVTSNNDCVEGVFFLRSQIPDGHQIVMNV